MARLAGARGAQLSALSESDAVSMISSALKDARTPIRLHGTRVEEMFVYAMAAVGGVRAIKREETDDLVTSAEDSLSIPDYRVVLADGTEILVEVKNVHERTPTKTRAPKLVYLQRLASYGSLFSRPVFLAVYWSAWRRWTLHSVADLITAMAAGRLVFSFPEAYRRSDMHLLGDALLGTRYPLELRFGVTAKILKRRGSRSRQLITIDTVELSVAGTTIANDRDRTIAFGLMVHGGWEESESVSMDGDRVAMIEYAYSPSEADPDAGFAPVTALSSLASAQFNDLTAGDQGVERLRPRDLPSPPYRRVGERYYGVDLPLWVLILKPDGSWSDARDTGAV